MIRQISKEKAYPLRARVLRPGLPIESCHYPLDDQAMHWGYYRNEELCSIVTVHADDFAKFLVPGQWRIRGMATAPEWQGQGFGRLLVQEVFSWARENKVPLIWCNAREVAIPFYEKVGMKVESDFFDIPGIGPHKVMRIDL